jgi:hypothetical protein
MSGPTLPRPVAGSNAIGSFVVGLSPIGSIPPFDWWSTIISQYANSAAIAGIIESFFQCVDQTANMDLFFDNLWNVTTAVGPGLDVWGRIVGVSRVLQVTGSQSYLGFEEAAPTGFGFGQQPFFSGQPVTSNYHLDDASFRTLIYAKALANITDGSIRSINAILLALFPNRGNTYVTDGEDMTMTYTFTFPLSPAEQAIVNNSGVLPRPTGVSATVVTP